LPHDAAATCALHKRQYGLGQQRMPFDVHTCAKSHVMY
jgi:hypothetical protein